MIDFSLYTFHPVIALPSDCEVFDFTKGYDPDRPLSSPYGIGRYDEDRRGMYTSALFEDPSGHRTIHMGIDLAAPVNTAIRSFYAGEVFLFGYNGAPGDYGYTLITRHEFGGEPLFALYGHLSEGSVAAKQKGQKIASGETIAWVGDRHENGGWNPHLHFQLSLVEPERCDLPGAVSQSQRNEALQIYPDPRLVLGPLY
ncbi:MAG TPA: peptidoglycan DD-metalloendopeptidase family protein [Bdellovibrionota bacterium]|jgi:murein DD-endopeptidase MepM/ murein hydrolase activator NlpD